VTGRFARTSRSCLKHFICQVSITFPQSGRGGRDKVPGIRLHCPIACLAKTRNGWGLAVATHPADNPHKFARSDTLRLYKLLYDSTGYLVGTELAGAVDTGQPDMNEVHFSPGDQFMITLSQCGLCNIWDLRGFWADVNKTPLDSGRLPPRAAAPTFNKSSPEERPLASNKIRLHASLNYREVEIIGVERDGVKALAWLEDGSFAVGGRESVDFYSLSSRACYSPDNALIPFFQLPRDPLFGPVTRLGLSPDGMSLIVGHAQKAATMYRRSAFGPLEEVKVALEPMRDEPERDVIGREEGGVLGAEKARNVLALDEDEELDTMDDVSEADFCSVDFEFAEEGSEAEMEVDGLAGHSGTAKGKEAARVIYSLDSDDDEDIVGGPSVGGPRIAARVSEPDPLDSSSDEEIEEAVADVTPRQPDDSLESDEDTADSPGPARVPNPMDSDDDCIIIEVTSKTTPPSSSKLKIK